MSSVPTRALPALPLPADADSLPCLLLWLAPDGTVLGANRAFSDFVGLHSDDAHEGWVWSALLDSVSHAALMESLLRQRDFSMFMRFKEVPARPAGAWLDGAARWMPDAGHYLCSLQDVTVRAVSQAEALQRAGRFEVLAGNAPVLIAYFDAAEMRCRFANQRYARTFGWDEQAIVGRTVLEIVGEAAAREIQPHVDQVLRERRPISYLRELSLRDGSMQWLEVHLQPQFDDSGELVAALVLISDVSRHRQAELAMRESQDRLSLFMQASAEAIVFHRDGAIVDVNPAACRLVGRPLEELLGHSALDFVAPDQRSSLADLIRNGDECVHEGALIHQDGHRVPVEIRARSLMHKGERVRMALVRDISERYRAQEHLRKLAMHDALTGLPNRLRLMDDLGHLIAESRRTDAQFALMFVDLDHFKRVNDSLGHLVGDTLLQIIARRITDALRVTDVVARFGGDEFIVLLPRLLQREDADEVARKLLETIALPVNADGQLISVTPSIGISLFPHDAGMADALIKNADTAMYLAKSTGRATYKFFRSAMARSAFEALVMESQLTQGLARGEFVLHFQPQVRASDGTLTGAEALVRWNHPERGLLMPDAFIELAEQQRLMLPLGQWVLREAVRCARRWFDAGVTQALVAVNLSSVQFQASGFTSLVRQLLLEEGVPGHLLELELTERMLMDGLPDAKRRLAELKALGIHISVDDFGTGYSSLAHLKELPIDKMKIDRSFVKDLPDDTDSAAIAQAIVQMSRSMGLTVIAEGVETPAQREFLTRLGADELQGLLISPPLAPAEFEAWMRANRKVPGDSVL